MASISFQHVNKTYPGGVEVVPDLNLEIKDKEFVILVGPSGCGKSTTLRMIAGLEDITSGELRIGDRVVNDIAPKDRDIAMVFQNYALYPHMSVYKNIAFGLQLARLRRMRSTGKFMKQLRSWIWSIFLTGNRRHCPAASVSVWLWDAPWCVTLRYSFWTSRCQTWMPNCVPPCVLRSANFTNVWTPPSYT